MSKHPSNSRSASPPLDAGNMQARLHEIGESLVGVRNLLPFLVAGENHVEEGEEEPLVALALHELEVAGLAIRKIEHMLTDPHLSDATQAFQHGSSSSTPPSTSDRQEPRSEVGGSHNFQEKS
jgi:hypothetical protein